MMPPATSLLYVDVLLSTGTGNYTLTHATTSSVHLSNCLSYPIVILAIAFYLGHFKKDYIDDDDDDDDDDHLSNYCLYQYLLVHCCSCCSTDVTQLKEMQVDYTAQHRIAIDLFHEIRSKGKFTNRPQCVLDAVQLVALTVSNLQRVELVLSQTDDINKDEVEQFHNNVKDHIYDLWKRVKWWLPSALPVMIGIKDTMELAVSIMLLLVVCFVLYPRSSLLFCSFIYH